MSFSLSDNFISSPFFFSSFNVVFLLLSHLFVAIFPRVCELFCANGNAQCLKVWVPQTSNHHPATLSNHPIPKDDGDGDADGQSRRGGGGREKRRRVVVVEEGNTRRVIQQQQQHSELDRRGKK